MLGQTMIIINSFQVADALLTREGSVFSDRPQATMACELVGWNRLITLMPMSDDLRSARAILHQSIGTTTSMEQYYSLIEMYQRKCMAGILAEPDKLVKHLRQYVSKYERKPPSPLH
jgi:hypothetical protein